ncbi:hypothetical protein SH528x_001894 [Novipirellula sp. SH528]|uniref:hypothetical protein n=1 Tax=Novipirellula sp. SH528 TaxID=3454466 RepID=UPI003FA0AF5D
MTISVNSAAQSHADHRHWKSDVECWSEDIQNWRMEHCAAIVQLQEAVKRINEHGKALDEHANAVASLETSLKAHEKNLAASLQNGSDAALDDRMNDQHAKQTELHLCQQNAHERMKKHHHQAIAKVAMLKHALEEAC